MKSAVNGPDKNRGLSYGVQHLECQLPSSLLEFVSGQVFIERARELIALGSIYVNDQRSTDFEAPLKLGDRVRLHLKPRRFIIPQNLEARITVETEDFVIVDKPAGLPVHALVDNIQENLIAALEGLRAQKFFVTHRLDIETSGLVIVAKNPQAQLKLNEAFKYKKLKRSYLALTETPVPLGLHVHFMDVTPTAPKTVSTEDHESALRCELRVLKVTDAIIAEKKVATSEGRGWTLDGPAPVSAFQVEIELLTGRTHQIRAQLKALGAPIIGDQSYGSAIPLRDSDTDATAIALWAFRIQTEPDETIL